MGRERILDEMVSWLDRKLGSRLVSVVLYGPNARGETIHSMGHFNLLLVVSTLSPATLQSLAVPIRWWLGKDQPWPRLLSPALIRDSLDAFPVEFLDLSRHRRVLHGEDPLADIDVDTTRLREQCERDLREKLMRLREGYVESGGAIRPLRRLLIASHTSFVPLWRACLHLLGCEVPSRDADVASRLRKQLEIEGDALEEVAALAAGGRATALAALFARYLDQLERIVTRVDRLIGQSAPDSPLGLSLSNWKWPMPLEATA